ncbi:TlpA disulfide reductase family protein [Jeotgalibacillus sp. R-1-5s-1]|uniref:TlpA family protein disulfide reductase n=1 Tax=Jeotgalibacillus sp. R-1-5s-1 TaxID=2555897 RepID=UPI00106AC4FD|nr:TlpA disulfide reductase family protein [Jeotgalibacillus sp. R-1-5s-1]TFD95820.1 TlpA family protein disulfide reductase [Jeotgalibacillus sp. R-1-5s-1]
MRKRGLAWLLMMTLCFVMFFMGVEDRTEPGFKQSEKAEAVSGSETYEKAPDFQLEMMNGTWISSDTLKGKPVILNFWTSWCPPCVEEMPELEAFYRTERERASIIAVNLTKGESGADAVKKFLDEEGLSLPVSLDREGVLQETFRISVIPTTIILTPDGRIFERIPGPVDQKKLTEITDRLLSSYKPS